MKNSERQWVWMRNSEGKKDLYLCVVYVGVDTADNTIPNNELFDLVEEEAKEILCKGNDLCLLGDFNAHIEDDKPDKNAG